MELEDLERRLKLFCEDRYQSAVEIDELTIMPGHAGFAYGFRVSTESKQESWFIRFPPPNVNWVGTADVLRQVEVLNALDKTDVPHCSVKWSGKDLEWFDRPYFVVPLLEGDVLRLGEDDWGSSLSRTQLENFGRQAMESLARIHKVSVEEVPYLGDPVPFEEDVTRWDKFVERAAEPQRIAASGEVRKRLIESIPSDAPVGIFHGDFQIANLFSSEHAKLLAVIDWELTGIGATLNDVGWICTFSDPLAWGSESSRPYFLEPETLITFYEDAHGQAVESIEWYRALAAYKFSVISGFNLSLHRRGKRVDETWEQTALSMQPLMERALDLLN